MVAFYWVMLQENGTHVTQRLQSQLMLSAKVHVVVTQLPTPILYARGAQYVDCSPPVPSLD